MRTGILMIAGLIPLCSGLAFSSHLMIALGQDARLAGMAEQYIRGELPIQ